MPVWNIRLLETIEEMSAVEALQREVWPGSETDVVPAHVLITAAHNGGVLLGAFADDELIGFIFGFPGLESTPDGPRPKTLFAHTRRSSRSSRWRRGLCAQARTMASGETSGTRSCHMDV